MDFDKDQPIYVQLIEDIKIDIINGSYESGDKLASIRDYAQEKLVNPNTAQKAYSELENQGYIYSKRGIGYFVNENEESIRKLKYEYLNKEVDIFIKKMTNMKFTKEEVIEKIKESL